MSLGPLVPRSNDPRSSDPSRELQPGEPAEFLKPITSALYNTLPAQESTLREYMRVLIKRKWMVISVIAGIFLTVAIASLRQTPIYEAVGRIAVNKADPNLITFKMCIRDSFHILRRHGMEHRQTDQPLISVFGHRVAQS